MKKLKLDQQKFAGAEVLSRAQLRKVMGGNGSGGGECDDECTEKDAKCIRPGTESSGTCKSYNMSDSCGKHVLYCMDGN